MLNFKNAINLNRKEKILIYVTVGIVVIFLFQKGILSGTFSKLKKLNTEIKKSEAELAIAMNIEKRKDMIEEDSKLYGPFINSAKLPDVMVVTNFLKELEDISKRSKVSIVNLSPESQGKEEAWHKKFYASLRFDASSDALTGFLYEIQKSNLLIKVEKIAISAKDENATALRVDAVMSMAAF